MVVIEHRHTFALQDGIVEKHVETALRPGAPHSDGVKRELENWMLRTYRRGGGLRDEVLRDTHIGF